MTNKYWPIVFWMYDLSGGDVLKYKPSPSHANVMRKCITADDALLFGLNRIKRQRTVNINAMPSLIVKVIKSDTKPDISAASTLRVFVQRIPINRRDD